MMHRNVPYKHYRTKGHRQNIQQKGVNRRSRYLFKPKNCHAPRLTGVPKVHKNGVPMRGIVSMVRSPFEKISKALIPILRTVQGRSGLYIKNSRELKEKNQELES